MRSFIFNFFLATFSRLIRLPLSLSQKGKKGREVILMGEVDYEADNETVIKVDGKSLWLRRKLSNIS